jgi:hypothetical protein
MDESGILLLFRPSACIVISEHGSLVRSVMVGGECLGSGEDGKELYTCGENTILKGSHEPTGSP